MSHSPFVSPVARAIGPEARQRSAVLGGVRRAAVWAVRGVCGLLTSVRFGVFLLVLIALAAIAGTFIEARIDTRTAQRLIYHAWWFMGLMALLAVTLNAASWPSYLATWRLPRTRPLRRTPGAFANLPEVREVTGGVEAITPERVAEVLAKGVGPVHREGQALFAQRGILQRWGFVVTHLGMTLLLAGGVYLSAMAHLHGPPGTAMVWIGEGMVRDWMWVDDPDHPGQLCPEGLPFALRLHDFDADFFPDTGVPRAFTSIVEITGADGRRSLHRVNMNEALRWEGWKFSQSSYVLLDSRLEMATAREFAQTDGEAFVRLLQEGRLTVRLVDTGAGRLYPDFDVGAGTCVPVPQSDLFFETPDGRRFRVLHGQTVLAEGEIANADLAFPGADKASRPRTPAPPQSGGRFTAAFVGRQPAAYSGLGVMREPKSLKAFFYVSFLLFLSGPFIAFTVAHCQVWAWVDPAGRRALIGGRARGRRTALAPLLDRLATQIKEAR